MKKRMLCLLTALCLCFGITSCGKDQSQNETKSQDTSSGTSTETTAADTTKTKLSGKVTVYMPSPAGLADKLAAAFTEKTGVEVEQFQGTTGEILARLEAEQANPVADVVILAS